MRNLFLLWALCLLTMVLHAQTPTRFTLQGRAVDTLNNALPSSTVMLLSPKDSSMVNFGRTDDKGAFTFKNLRAGSYILKVTFVGYIPYNALIKNGDDAVLDLGGLKLKPITKELMEVVVRTAKAPLTIKGDTIEYNAASFKVPPGSTVEDLLRKLPGVQIDQDGNIRAQGQAVNKVTVDGKQFFGSDPKLATKNLQADAITKVQVFNDKTEQAKLTGIDDGKKEKTVNLQLKDEFKKGGFGKLTAGAGPASNNVSTRYDVRGNYNKFDSKRQLSAVLLGNNTNQGGLSWNDYQDFRGSNSFNWNDDADFGFSGSGRYITFGDDNESLSIPISGGDNRGFTRNLAGGVNYNYDTKKTKLSSSYFFNQTLQDLFTLREQERFLPNKTQLNTRDTSTQMNRNANHRVSLRFEKQLDTMQTLVLISNGRLGIGNNNLTSFQSVNQSINRGPEQLYSTSNTFNGTQANQFALANTALYRLKFKKKGRSFAASATYQITNNDADLLLKSTNDFYQATTVNDMFRNLRNLNQDQNTALLSNQYKASLLYVEPFAKKFYWESFYNFSLRFDEVDRGVFNLNDSRRRIDTLSLYYKNNYTYNRLGSSIRYSFKGLNLSAGLAGQSFVLDGQYNRERSQELIPIRRTYNTLIPNIGLNYDLKNNKYLYGGYTVGVQIPSSRDLQPVRTITNPLYVTTGNPNLLPGLNKEVQVGFSYFNPGSFINFWSNVFTTWYDNQIVYGQSVDTETLITTTTPENISGGRSTGGYMNFGFPLKKTKATLSLNGQFSAGRSFTPIRQTRQIGGVTEVVPGTDILNETQNQNINGGARLELTPKEWITFYGNANVNITNAQYSVNTGQNQTIYTYTYRGDLNLKFPKDIYLNTTFNYRSYINDQLGFRQQVPILNTSLYHIIGKAKRAEVRLSAYDLLNRNVFVSQYNGQNYSQTESIQTLARHFLLSFTYNMRGVTAKMRRQDFY
jgi:hypothetical protein